MISLIILSYMFLVIICGFLNIVKDKQALLRKVLLYALSISLFYYIIGLIVTR